MHDDMVERVARAMADLVTEPKVRPLVDIRTWLVLARAAIKAMRKPTDAMLSSVGEDYWDADIHWQMMIDAALRKDASNAR